MVNIFSFSEHFWTLSNAWSSCIKTKVGGEHRYRKAKIDCLSFVMCPLLAQPIIAFFSSFFAAAVYSTNEANKAGGTRR